MSGIYLHIPFCKQACYYCDFHFSTNQSYRALLIQCLAHEISLQKDYLYGDKLETIYFGGGTPSLLNPNEFELLFETIHKNFKVDPFAEITLEANPDDLTQSKIQTLKAFGVNRLSLGIQSLDDEVLKFLNRAHSANDALVCIELLRESGFNNLSIDLIHSIPGQDESTLMKNLDKALNLSPEHISAYSLTVEENTVFGRWAAKGKLKSPDENASARQFEVVMNTLIDHGYRHYEISNFCKPGYYSRHNSSYWNQAKYLGVGPSAHSYNRVSRQFNVANNHLYMKSIQEGKLPSETEILTRADKINEYIFTSLRTDIGCQLTYLKNIHAFDLLNANDSYLRKLLEEGKITIQNEVLMLTHSGKLLADRIASDLFILSE
jgi:oxygen-independent coproporphyrinogen-3 oxidase